MAQKTADQIQASAERWGMTALLSGLLVGAMAFIAGFMGRNQFGWTIHGDFRMVEFFGTFALNPFAWFFYFATGMYISRKGALGRALLAQKAEKPSLPIADRVAALERQVFEKQ